MTIRIEIEENEILEGKLITWSNANKITKMNCKGLIYLGNVMDLNSSKNQVYAWLKDEDTQEYYLIEL